GRVGMLGAGDDVELLDHLAAEAVLRQHAAHRLLDGRDPPGGHQVAVLHAGDAARVAGVPPGDLVLELLAGELDLVGVDHDHVVARVHVRREHRLVLAAQQGRHLRGQAPEDLAVGVQDVPAALDVLRLGRVGLHGWPSSERCRPGGAARDQGYLRQRGTVKGMAAHSERAFTTGEAPRRIRRVARSGRARLFAALVVATTLLAPFVGPAAGLAATGTGWSLVTAPGAAEGWVLRGV